MSGVKGVLEQIAIDAYGTKEDKKKSNLEDRNQSTKRIKRGYHLKPSTIKKLEEMKVFMYPVETSLGDIVEEAICMLYEKKKQG